jgi:hypothetical protein
MVGSLLKNPSSDHGAKSRKTDQMAFADPQSVTINAVANSLPRVSSSPNSSVYQKDDGLVRLTVSHQYGKTNRRTIRIDHRKVGPDPFTSDNKEFTMAAYVVVAAPVVGYTNVEIKQIVDALTAYLTASSGARVTQLLGGEN